ncbi:CHAT domain-containing protein [Suillus subalutaceus]|uniref:CHAT domain-containing protein n=1 Tax=Suillus subalutaceus TaxID=48586 RepID=UPI001B85E786|nr:CHAT domain-containing protein [Suillus subalutaceus]KAG1861135.1 CHAT domain-containing protein [Suillus subalutaceus]
MRTKPLSLLDIIENDAPQAEFAFLSACHATCGDKKIPDEVIHLAAGLQFSGFKSVVGTLWEVDDAVARHVVGAFYENMFKNLDQGVMDCTKAAWALNKATYAVKKKFSGFHDLLLSLLSSGTVLMSDSLPFEQFAVYY